jgi:hypothetical protein
MSTTDVGSLGADLTATVVGEVRSGDGDPVSPAAR